LKLKAKGYWRIQVQVSVKVCAAGKYSNVSCAMEMIILLRVTTSNLGALPPRRSLSLSFKQGIEFLLVGQSVDGRIL
jgi:hypothetical protein